MVSDLLNNYTKPLEPTGPRAAPYIPSLLSVPAAVTCHPGPLDLLLLRDSALSAIPFLSTASVPLPLCWLFPISI